MQIIPVLDLQRGRVVHARHGQCRKYKPLRSTLVDCSAVLPVLTALQVLWPFRQVYIADLDAIENQGENTSLIKEMYAAFPRIDFWVDAGLHGNPARYAPQAMLPGITPVLGTENDPEARISLPLLEQYPQSILSLDIQEDAADTPWLGAIERWPGTIIVMSLDRVGSMQGPDYKRLAGIRQRCPDRRLYAAGGIGTIRELHRLAAQGIHGVLLASALHQGTITQAELSGFLQT